MQNPRFHELLKKIADTHDRKNADYSNGKDPFSNFRECEKMGINAWEGCLIRMGDKMSRLYTLSTKPASVVEESFEDTLLDLSIYCLICILLREDAKHK